MKKFTLSTLALSLTLAGFAQKTPQNIADDFDNEGTIEWSSFQGTVSEFNQEAVNPNSSDINTSDIVAEWKKNFQPAPPGAGGTQFNGIVFEVETPFDFSANPEFTFKYYFPDNPINQALTNKTITLFVEVASEDPSMAFMRRAAITKTVDLANEWKEITFNFATDNVALGMGDDTPATQRMDLDKVVIQFGGDNNMEEALAYFDDFSYNMDLALSTNEFDTNNVAVYLDRSTSMLHIDGQLESRELTVYDLSGRSITTEAISGAQTEINVAGLSSGIYFVATENGAKKFAL